MKKTHYQYDCRTVKIGACAFQRCFCLQHVSVHASFIGSAAFAASGLRSTHLLLSKPAVVGDDIFFNCIDLKECLIVLGEAESGMVDSFFNGLFWNCFSLETVCMPNIQFRSGLHKNPEIAKRKEPGLNIKGFTMFNNCFSLKELDLRYFVNSYQFLLPCGIKQSNHKLLVEGNYGNYCASYCASCPFGVKIGYDADTFLKIGYVEACCQQTKKPFEFFKHEDSEKYKNMSELFGKPCCDVQLVTFIPEYFRKHVVLNVKVPSMSYDQPIHVNNSDFHTLIEMDSFSYSEPLYDAFMIKDQQPVFRRFNDAYLKWFVKKEENEIEEKPKNDLLNKKRKYPFVVRGG